MSAFLLGSDIAEIVERLRNDAQAFSGKTVLLTGGRGFLGRFFMEVFGAFTEGVLNEPVKLVAMDNMITAGKEGARMGSTSGLRHSCRWHRQPLLLPRLSVGNSRSGYHRHTAHARTRRQA